MKFFLIFLFSFSLYAERQYTFKHPTCNVYLSNEKSAPFRDLVLEELKKKNLHIKNFADNNRMEQSGEMHLSYAITHLPGMLYKDCVVAIALKHAKGQRALKSDKVLYEQSVKRKFPRVTRQGNERCRRAIKDAFLEIPYCQNP